MSVTLYHNPRCSKSRETLALLETHAVEPDIIEYLKTPLNEEQITALVKLLALDSARDMMRTKEDLYKALNLKSQTNEAELVKAMADNPKLIERPIVVNGDKAAIGRPPENVLSVL
ncbi:arsenate reductase (glutaredoxin) [Pseudoalteromonas sp. H105]|uniref:arsenate reductase (glutaredoxin) n=1 Tax=Pseudoalteromonas sp. H105 TaxID=1348393 RepID=UPI0007322E30|nr:arsenate reductase (glutaredoxin) [Pseudoalteromonas sp. H105]KTF17869.1 arsenate reductase [Pseudoalteromonas sp. H105]